MSKNILAARCRGTLRPLPPPWQAKRAVLAHSAGYLLCWVAGSVLEILRNSVTLSIQYVGVIVLALGPTQVPRHHPPVRNARCARVAGPLAARRAVPT